MRRSTVTTLNLWPIIAATLIAVCMGPSTGMETHSRPANSAGSPMQSITTASAPSRSASTMRAVVAGCDSMISKSHSIEAGPASICEKSTLTPSDPRPIASSTVRNPCVVIGVTTLICMAMTDLLFFAKGGARDNVGSKRFD